MQVRVNKDGTLLHATTTDPRVGVNKIHVELTSEDRYYFRIDGYRILAIVANPGETKQSLSVQTYIKGDDAEVKFVTANRQKRHIDFSAHFIIEKKFQVQDRGLFSKLASTVLQTTPELAEKTVEDVIKDIDETKEKIQKTKEELKKKKKRISFNFGKKDKKRSQAESESEAYAKSEANHLTYSDISISERDTKSEADKSKQEKKKLKENKELLKKQEKELKKSKKYQLKRKFSYRMNDFVKEYLEEAQKGNSANSIIEKQKYFKIRL